MENSNISLAFRLNYLLGTKESKIKDLFPLEYEESKDLKLFEYYCDAKVLRYLSILRNSVFVDFAKYNKKTSNSIEGFSCVTQSMLTYLKKAGIDIQKLFYDNSLSTYVNLLTRMINVISFKVLVDLEVPYIDELLEYFKFPFFNDNTLNNFAGSCNSISTANGTYFYNGKNIRATVKYALNNDNNVVMSAFSMVGKVFNDTVVVPPFIFREKMGEDIDKDAKIVVENIKKDEETYVKSLKADEEVKKAQLEAEDKVRAAEVERVRQMKEKEKIKASSEEQIKKLEDIIKSKDKEIERLSSSNVKGNKESESQLELEIKKNKGYATKISNLTTQVEELNKRIKGREKEISVLAKRNSQLTRQLMNNGVVNLEVPAENNQGLEKIETENSVVTVVSSVEDYKVESFETKDIKDVKTDNSTLVVDCSSVDFFKFVCYLRKCGKFSKVILVNDFEKNVIWNTIDSIFEFLNVIKVNCSDKNIVSDKNILLTHSICKELYTNALNSIMIYSNSESFYSLFEELCTARIQICAESLNNVGYKYLRSKQIPIIDVSKEADKSVINQLSSRIVGNYVLYSVVSKSLFRFDIDSIKREVTEMMGNFVSEENINSVVDTVSSDISIKIDSGKTTVSSGNLSVVI